MKRVTKHTIAFITALILLLALLAACRTPEPEQAPTPVATPEPTPVETPEPTPAPQTLVVGYSPFFEGFSPFLAETPNDQDAADMTQIYLLYGDREGKPVLNAIGGETRTFNGTDYTYYGPADIAVEQKSDGTADYHITLRDDIFFSDGEPVTIDDLIFSMYVFADPDYDGDAVFHTVPITGIDSYRTGLPANLYDKYEELATAIYEAGADNEDFTQWTQEQQDTFWVDLLIPRGIDFAWEIVDYCMMYVGEYPNEYEMAYDDDVTFSMLMWGFGEPDEDGLFIGYYTGKEWNIAQGQFPSIEDFWGEINATYEGDLASLTAVESAGMDLYKELMAAFITREGQKDPDFTGDFTKIEGIRKTGTHSATVTADYYEATSIYQFALPIAPLHYYGDTELYDYDNNMFGFPKGDLSQVREKTAEPMGAGYYKFVSYDNGIVSFEANPLYYLGEPKIQYVRFRETSDGEKLDSIVSGRFDIAEHISSAEFFDEIRGQNSNGELSGDTVATNTALQLGYGYIGISAENVNVGGKPESTESKNLRKAFATVLSVYREAANDAYFGDSAETIQYPVSNTSWAAPRPDDEGYREAYSLDADGNDIYRPDMSEQERYDAALEAAIGFFKAAGYTWDEDEEIFAEAPRGAKLEYEIYVAGYSVGDHPAYSILTGARDALETIGITLEIIDPANPLLIMGALDAGEADMWCAVWQSAVDPDMYQIYHSLNIPGMGGTNDNRFFINDYELDELIMQARFNDNQTYRKQLYKSALEIVLDWAVEIPNYQCSDAVIFSPERINMETVTPDITAFWGWASELHLLEMNKVNAD